MKDSSSQMSVFAVPCISYLLAYVKIPPTIQVRTTLVSYNHRLGTSLSKLNENILGESIVYMDLTIIIYYYYFVNWVLHILHVHKNYNKLRYVYIKWKHVKMHTMFLE